MVTISVPATGAGVGGGHQRDPCRETGFQPRTAQSVNPLLQGLAQLIQDGSRKFSQFIQEEHASMGQAHLTGTWVVTAAEQCCR